MLYNINQYNETTFRKNWEQSDICKQIIADTDIVIWKRNFEQAVRKLTPRHMYGSKIVSVVSCYFINYLYENNPSIVYDIGCGVNWFKQFYPNILGVGAETDYRFYGDECWSWDEDTVITRSNSMDAMFAINSLHFIPVTEVKERIEQVVTCISPNGRAYLSLNSRVVSGHTPSQPTTEQVIAYLRYDLAKIEGVRWLAVDMDSSYSDGYMDGNINLVLEKL
jgi:hypothetical protein